MTFIALCSLLNWVRLLISTAGLLFSCFVFYVSVRHAFWVADGSSRARHSSTWRTDRRVAAVGRFVIVSCYYSGLTCSISDSGNLRCNVRGNWQFICFGRCTAVFEGKFTSVLCVIAVCKVSLLLSVCQWKQLQITAAYHYNCSTYIDPVFCRTWDCEICDGSAQTR